MQTTVEIFREDLPRAAERGTTGTLQGNTAPGGVCSILESVARFFYGETGKATMTRGLEPARRSTDSPVIFEPVEALEGDSRRTFGPSLRSKGTRRSSSRPAFPEPELSVRNQFRNPCFQLRLSGGRKLT